MVGNLDFLEKIKNTMKKAVKSIKSNVLLFILTISLIFALASTLKQYSEKKDLKTSLSSVTEQLEDKTAKLMSVTEELTASKDEVKLLEDTTAALRRQVTGLNATMDDLKGQLENLLNIEDTPIVITRTQLQEQINSIKELATVKYIYTNSNRKEDEKTWLWGWTMPFSDTSLLVTYDGTIKVGIDLSDVKIDVDETKRTITVTLPKSKILDNYIPQETINVLEVREGLFNKVTFDDYNQFIVEEKQVMEEKAIERGILTDAHNEAKSIVEAFLKSIPGMDTYKLVIK
ncbi:MAG: DUF4230 domain-containing protein [Oscillospiraceae bacterium]|nr:DUF4230 domain-containing protein [Oscillospiraceae bacterium]